MNIQKQVICQIFKEIITLQQQLEAIRQLLNQEIAFSLNSTFTFAGGDSKIVNLFTIKKFIQASDGKFNDSAIQSMIKFYSKGELQLGMTEWKLMFLSRQDQLLAKLAKERQFREQEPPQYILSYCRKVIIKEELLHSKIHDLQKRISSEKMVQQICNIIMLEFNENQIYLLKRYLLQGNSFQSDYFPSFQLKKLVKRQNSNKVKHFLLQKEEEFIQKQNKKCAKNNPFLHQQFKKLKGSRQTTNILFRHTKSIENHINRNHTPSSSRIIQKIQAYTSHLEKSLEFFFKSFYKIMKLNSKIIKEKVQLLSSNPVNFSLTFQQISKNHQIIPSELRHYLKKLNFEVPLQSCFLLFKRYSDLVTGKMNKKQFSLIFKLCYSPPIQKASNISKNIRQNIALCLINEINYEAKIQVEKKNLMENIDLRQIFQAVDVENHRRLSQTDFKVMYKKIISKSINQEFVDQFWWRMKAISDEYVDYDRFMYELIPRTKMI